MATFLNIRYVNAETHIVDASAKTRRNPSILTRPEDYVLSIDRWALDHGYFPVFHDIGYSFRLLKKSDSSTTDQVVDLSAITDSNGFGYSLSEFIDKLNASVAVALTAVGQPTTDLVFELQTDHTVKLTSTVGFRTAYELHLDQKLFSSLSFAHYSPPLNETWSHCQLRLGDGAGDVAIHTHSAIRVSCVARILLISNNIPVESELVGSGDTITRETAKILSDFNVNADLLHPVNDMYFVSRDIKPHAMQRSNFSDAEISFYYTVHGTRSFYKVKLTQGGACSVKVRFDETD